MAATQQIDLELLHQLIIHEPLAIVGKVFADAGPPRLKGILRFLKQCARHSTVHAKSDVTVFALMQPDAAVDQERLAQAQGFQFGVTARGSIGNLIVEIREDGSPFVWQQLPANMAAISQTGIVYRLVQAVETFSINGATLPVPKVIPGAISQFCINYFTDLKEALIAYRDSMARTSKCHILQTAWAEPNRLWFIPKPEFILRKALHNYLYSYLRHDDIDLREEQNVNEKNPVDIKLVWRMENRSAIVEVKWLGKSIDIKTRKVKNTYNAGRAREGAKQLAEYLEWHRQQAAKEDTRGYLVVFDCRRNRLKVSASTVDKANGHHYEKREVPYAPEYHKTRKDFEEPIRMFLEPICI